MFGLGKKKKFIEAVEKQIHKTVKMAKIEEENDLVHQIRKELEESGASKEEQNSIKFSLFVETAVSQPLETDADYMYKNFDVPQAAIYTISLYISNVTDSRQLESFKEEQLEMYQALLKLWYICLIIVEDNYEHFAPCMRIPKVGNPFPEST